MSEGSKHYGKEYNMKGRDNNKFICSQIAYITKKLCFEDQSVRVLPDSTSNSREQPPSVANDRESYFICC